MAFDFSRFASTPYMTPTAYQSMGVLGGQPGGGGVLGGGGQSAWQQLLDPQVALPMAAAMIAGKTPQESLAGAVAQAGPALGNAKKKAAFNKWFKAGAPRDPSDPAFQELLQTAPDIGEKYAATQLAPTGSELTAEQKNYRAGLKDPGFRDFQEKMHPGSDPDNPVSVGRWTRAANSAVKPYTELTAYKLVQNAIPYLSRIEAVRDMGGSVSDQDLLDTMVKINTGGGQVTEAQVNTVLKGRSFGDELNVWKNYFLSHGGVLSAEQRKEMQEVAHAVYSGYQKMYKPIYETATKAMKDRGIPEAYWSAIPDLEHLSNAAGISLEAGGAAGGAPTGGAQGDPLAQARDAIARGAPKDAVIKRLQENGIDPSGL